MLKPRLCCPACGDAEHLVKRQLVLAEVPSTAWIEPPGRAEDGVGGSEMNWDSAITVGANCTACGWDSGPNPEWVKQLRVENQEEWFDKYAPAAPFVLHRIKCDFEPWASVLTGRKAFEFRRNDRGYRAGDRLLLFQTDRDDRSVLTGKCLLVEVPYVLYSGEDYGLPDGTCIMTVENSKEIYPPDDVAGRLWRYLR